MGSLVSLVINSVFSKTGLIAIGAFLALVILIKIIF